MSEKTIFISYSHDSAEHRESVLALSERLRADGFETLLDQYVNGSPNGGWPRWMLDQLDAANYVLVVCTETYYRRFRGHEVPGKGKGVDWEGALITQEIYDSRSQTLKFVPVFLSASVENSIPEPLRSGTHYALTSENAYQGLCDFLLGVAGVEAGAIGTLKKRERRTGTPLTFDGERDNTGPERNVDISRLTHAAEKLIGRETELYRLDEAWKDPSQHVLIIRGIGGEGKTSLVAEWANQLAMRDYDGASYFDWSFYSQGTRDQTSASSEPFIAAALGFFGGDEGKALANTAASARDKVVKLLEYIRAHRTLLVLDGLEPLQYPPGPLGGQLRDDAMSVLLKGLALSNPGLCVATTREPVTDLARFQDSTAPEWELEHLSEEAGAALLKRLLEPQKPKGVHQVRSTAEERNEICLALKGHALTLRLLGGFIHRALRDVRRWREVDYTAADAQLKTNPKTPNARYGHAFKTIEAYEHWFASGGTEGARQVAVLRLLGLFDRPADGALLAALRSPPAISGLTEPLVGLSEQEWNTTLSYLEECGLVALPKTDGTPPFVDAHPLLREYFGQRLREHQPEAWRAAHRRLYEHLCASTQEGDQPTLEALQPLYQAVAHGCQAGLQQETYGDIYFPRIGKGNNAYAVNNLGAFGSDLGAVACFFDEPWKLPASIFDEERQGMLLNRAAFRLRALGRRTEALTPFRAGLELRIKQKLWFNAARFASNLSELELTLGEVAGAVGDAEQSVTYADRSGDWAEKMGKRTTHAESQPAYPLLYSLQGFRYCDFLMAEAERASWGKDEGGRMKDELLATCRAVSERAVQTLKWAEMMGGQGGLLDPALNHLTLGRAALYAAILTRSDGILPSDRDQRRQDAVAPWETARRELDNAVSGLRRAGQQHMLVLGLLTRAWLRFLAGARTGPESAQEDLDEAWEIAERGPMKLHMADIHLYRARLFGRMKVEDGRMKYPWESPQADLAAAEKLINECGYGRRREELADAKRAILGA